MRTSAHHFEIKREAHFYDREGEYIGPEQRKETKAYAAAILALIKATRNRKKEPQWISGPQIRRQVKGDVRLWDAAMGLLVEDVEIREGAILQYRIREMRPLVRKTKFEISTVKTDRIMPSSASLFGEEYAKAF